MPLLFQVKIFETLAKLDAQARDEVVPIASRPHASPIFLLRHDLFLIGDDLFLILFHAGLIS